MSAEEFVRLRTSEKHEEYSRAHVEEVTPDAWTEIIEKYPDMREWVAHNRTVPLEILRILACDADSRVRSRVAMKRKIRFASDIIERLAQDEDENIRRQIALRPDTPSALIEKLAQDQSEWVKQAACSRMDRDRHTKAL